MMLRMISKKSWRSFPSLSLVYVWVFTLCSIGLTKEDANTQLIVSNDKYQVSFAGEKLVKERPWVRNFIFEIVDKKTQEVNQFVLAATHKPIKEMYLKLHLLEDNELVIQTKWKKRRRASTGIHIVDAKRNELVDEFWCYEPVLSPSKRFWIYEKFYPPYGLPAERTSVVLLYDMEKSPLENRLPVEGYTEWPKEQVGLPVYPEPYVKARAYVLVEQQQQNPFWYHLCSPFLWSADANDVVFLCTHQKQTYILRVNISAGIDKPKIFKSPIVVSNFIKPTLSEESRKRQVDLLHTISVTDIAWDGPNHVIVKPSKAYYNILQDKVRLTVP